MKTKIHTLTIAVTDGRFYEPDFSGSFPHDLATELEKTLAEYQKTKCATYEAHSITEARIAELGTQLEAANAQIDKLEKMLEILKKES